MDSRWWYLLLQVEYIGHLLQKQHTSTNKQHTTQAMMTPIDTNVNIL